MIDKEILAFFAGWIEKECGIVYEESNLYQLKDRIEQMLKLFNLSSEVEFYKLAKDGLPQKMRQSFIDIATNNETSFFRDTKFFTALESHILPNLIKDSGGLEKLQIWSAACSCGQEPYTLAIILRELSLRSNENPPKIFATDISERALLKAETGKYTDLEVSRGLPTSLRDKYFKKDNNNQWNLLNEIKRQVEFKTLNFTSEFSLQRQFDLILCRNVLIYQRIEAKRKIISRLNKHLRPGGILLMGAGESLMGLSTDFDQSLEHEVSVYRLKKNGKAAA